MLTELLKFDYFRVMPQRIQYPMKSVDGKEIVQMEYCEPAEADSWALEGVLEMDPQSERTLEEQANNREVEFIAEFPDQFDAYFVKDLIEKEYQYLEGERHLKTLQERRSHVGSSSN